MLRRRQKPKDVRLTLNSGAEIRCGVKFIERDADGTTRWTVEPREAVNPDDVAMLKVGTWPAHTALDLDWLTR